MTYIMTTADANLVRTRAAEDRRDREEAVAARDKAIAERNAAYAERDRVVEEYCVEAAAA